MFRAHHTKSKTPDLLEMPQSQGQRESQGRRAPPEGGGQTPQPGFPAREGTLRAEMQRSKGLVVLFGTEGRALANKTVTPCHGALGNRSHLQRGTINLQMGTHFPTAGEVPRAGSVT